MVAYSFKQQFIGPILSGAKRQTIRADRKRHARAEEELQLYVGARGDVTTNSVEGFFGIVKRGMTGIYQHCGEQHLQRYLNEFSFRYSYRIARGYDDTDRATLALKGSSGKRLTYRRINGTEDRPTD